MKSMRSPINGSSIHGRSHSAHFFTTRQPLLRSACPKHILVRASNEGEEPVVGNPLFNEQFLGVLQQSLARSGADALTQGVIEEPKTSATVEVLTDALGQSKRTLAILQQWRNQIDGQIAAQEKQVNRMEFALNKVRNDAAYMNALKDMVYNSEGE